MLTAEEYPAALKRCEELLEVHNDPDPESAEGIELLALIDRIEEYEKHHHPIAADGAVAEVSP